MRLDEAKQLFLFILLQRFYCSFDFRESFHEKTIPRQGFGNKQSRQRKPDSLITTVRVRLHAIVVIAVLSREQEIRFFW